MRNSCSKNLGKFNSLKNLNDVEQFSYVFKNFSIGFFRTCYEQLIKSYFRSSRPQMFFKIGVLKNFANFTGKHLCVVLRPTTLFQRDSRTSLWNFPNFSPHKHLRWLLLFLLQMSLGDVKSMSWLLWRNSLNYIESTWDGILNQLTKYFKVFFQ